MTHPSPWLTSLTDSLSSYHRMIHAAVAQLTDDELFSRPTPTTNSVAILLRHLGGNLASRWTDFLTTDGEKPTRDRDTEFLDWTGDRASLLAHFESGWTALTTAIQELNETTIHQTIHIRGEPHTLPQALTRSLTHIAYHTGQITLIARTVHQGQWKWLTIPPNQSAHHNQSTWSTPQSRSILGTDHRPDNADKQSK